MPVRMLPTLTPVVATGRGRVDADEGGGRAILRFEGTPAVTAD